MNYLLNKYFIIVFFIILICFLFFPLEHFLKEEKFPTPELLKQNVEFWKKIYTQVSLDEGLLHDRLYPQIVYEKISIKDKKRKEQRDFIKAKKENIRITLVRLACKGPNSEYSKEEKRIFNLFKKYAKQYNFNKAVNQIRFQRGQKQRFLAGLERSGKYLYEIRNILRQYNIPLKLAYLPHVESSFNSHAHSKAGASGLWQFIRSTGRDFLTIRKYIDERRDPILSTVAAAKLLKRNYKAIESWPLAITAYNYGLGGIKRAVKSTGSKDIATIIKKHKSRSFQFASINFYSCFLAASEIAENHDQYFENINFQPPEIRQKIILKQRIKVRKLCNMFDLSLKAFKKCNPSIKRSFYYRNRYLSKGQNIFLPISVDLKKTFFKKAFFQKSYQ